MKILSNDNECHWFSKSFSWNSNSLFKILTVLSVDFFKISETPIKLGLLSIITQLSGEIVDSQSVKAYSASIVLSGEIPKGK